MKTIPKRHWVRNLAKLLVVIVPGSAWLPAARPAELAAADTPPRPTLAEMAAVSLAARGIQLTADERRLFELVEEDAETIDGGKKLCRAEILRWLCSDPQASARVPHRGLRLWNVTVEGRLDLRFLKIAFPIGLWQSSIPAGIDLRSVEIPKFDLRGSHTSDVAADNIQVKGDLLLSEDEEDGDVPFEATGRVVLSNARIGGDLGLTNGRFTQHNGAAIQADGLHVGGTIYLGRAQIRGQLHLVDASVGGVVLCTATTFVSPAMDVFSSTRDIAAARFDRLTVGGDLLLDSVNSGGEIRIVNSKIGGNLDCSSANLVHPEGDVLSLARSDIRGHLFLDDGFRSNGRILLQQSHVAGNLTLEDDVELANSVADKTLEAVRLTIDGDVRLQYDFASRGNLSLTELKVGGDLVLSDWKRSSDRPLNVDLHRTEVTGRFLWQKMPRPDLLSVSLRYVTLGTLCEDESFGRCRSVDLFGLSYQGLDGNASLTNRLHWLRQHSQSEPPPNFVVQPYEAMAKALRNAGDDPAARKVEVAKEEHRKDHTQIEIEKWVWYKIVGPIIGYGYSPLDVLNVAGVIILVSGIVFSAGKRAGLVIRAKKDGTGIDGSHYPRFNPLIYALETFAPLLKMYTAEYWVINTDRRTGRLLRWYLWAHILTGWLVMTLLIAGVAGLVHK